MKRKLGTLLTLLACGMLSMNAYAAKSTSETSNTSNTSETQTCKHTFRAVPKERADATTKKSGTLVDKCTKCGYKTNARTIAAPSKYTLSKTKYKYSKKACNPTVTVKDKNGNTISNANYTVTYKKNIKPGKAYAVVKFKGNYKGTKNVKFKIKPLAPTKVKATAVNTSSGVSLSWKKSTGAVSYKVYRSVKGGKWTCLGTTKSTTYKDKTATKINTCYKYYVIAVANGGVKSAKSKVVYTNKYTADKKVYTKVYKDIKYEINQEKKTVTLVEAMGDEEKDIIYHPEYGRSYKNHKGTLTIKSYVDGYPVRTIGGKITSPYGEAIDGGIQATLYTKIIIPDTVVKINDEAFSGNDALKTIVFPKNLKYVGEGVFDFCSSFTGTLEIPDSLYCHPTFDVKTLDGQYTKGSTNLEVFSGLFNEGVTVKLPKTFTAIEYATYGFILDQYPDTTFITPLKADEIYVVVPAWLDLWEEGVVNKGDIHSVTYYRDFKAQMNTVFCPNLICAE